MMRNRLTIAFFMQDFAGGGVERMRIALADALAARGYRVLLVVVRAEGALANAVPDRVMRVDLGGRRAVLCVLRLRRFLRREQPDVLVSSLDHNNVAAMLACIGMGHRTRLVICQHNALSAEMRLGWRYRIVPALYHVLIRAADGIIAVSAGVADDLAAIARLPRDRITVIANPAVDPASLPDACCPPPHPWLGDGSCPVFVFAGRLVEQKDPLFLVQAFALRCRREPARLIVLGDGPLRAAMIDLVERQGLRDCVHFAGYVDDPRPWIGYAAALLLTSRYEGFGNVIAEALACGTPVVSTDCPHGPAEILASGQFGELVPVGDVQGFARAMCGDLRARFPAASLRARAQRYDVRHCADRHEELFARLLPGPAVSEGRLFGLALSSRNAAAIAGELVDTPAGRLRLVVTPNLNHVRLLRRRDFLAACGSADIVCADGWPVALYARLRGSARAGRVTGCDILQQVLAHPASRRLRLAVVVESAPTAAQLQRWMAANDLTGRWHVEVAPQRLSANPAAEIALAASLLQAAPDLLVMTLGAPVSEVFVHRHTALLPSCWVICVGQAMRVELGLVRRAPSAWRRLGLEWAWRCRQEPARLAVRYALDALWFPLAVAGDLWRETASRVGIAKRERAGEQCLPPHTPQRY